MKKYIFFISLCISASSFAQEKLILGFDAGSTMAGDHYTSPPAGQTYSIAPAYLFGVEAGYGFSERVALRMQFFIDERRIENKVVFDNGIYSSTFSTGGTSEYVEIPITLKYNLFEGRTHGYFFGGPVIAFNIGDDYGSKTNFGVVGGLGYSHDLTHIVTFFAEGGFTLGFSNISRDYWNKTFSRDFRLNAGLLFNIGLPLQIDY